MIWLHNTIDMESTHILRHYTCLEQHCYRYLKRISITDWSHLCQTIRRGAKMNMTFSTYGFCQLCITILQAASNWEPYAQMIQSSTAPCVFTSEITIFNTLHTSPSPIKWIISLFAFLQSWSKTISITALAAVTASMEYLPVICSSMDS